MEKVRPNVDNLSPVGYYTSKEDRKENYYKTESHIHKQGPLTGLKVEAHKLTNDVFTYFPKGFAGSKNSDFYEYLSMGKIPNIAGSLTLIALYGASIKHFNKKDGMFASQVAKRMGAGVALYALGKWLSPKISRLGTHLLTGWNADMHYLAKNNELPEGKQEKGMVRIQYPKVFDSVNFYRSDLLAKDSELNHGDMYWYNDKLAKRAGYGNKKLNASNQEVGEKIRGIKSRSTAMENISKYIAAATGVALGSQKAFSKIILPKFHIKDSLVKGDLKESINNLKTNIKSGASATFTSTKTAFKDGAKQLWNGTDRNLLTKHYGKALVLLSAASTILTCLIPSIAFKTNPNTMKSKVDTNKEYEVC